MVVALTFDGGHAHLRSRFVATRNRIEEHHQKAFVYRGQMGTHPNSALKDTALLIKSWLSLRWPKLNYRNPSNTNVFYWGGKVCLLCNCNHGNCNNDGGQHVACLHAYLMSGILYGHAGFKALRVLYVIQKLELTASHMYDEEKLNELSVTVWVRDVLF